MSTTTLKPRDDNANGLVTQPAGKLIVQDDSEVSYLLDTARFEHLQRIAQMLAVSALTPQHLKGKSPAETVANCFRVVNQAIRWKFDPFAVADETYVVGGRLGYQGKLVAAVVNARSRLRGRLRCTYSGSGPTRTVMIHGHFVGEEEERTIELSIQQAQTKNQMWTTDPDQKLYYSGVIKWARRHCPEVIMGVLTVDDIERMQESSMPSGLPELPSGTKSDQLAAILGASQEPEPEPEPQPQQDQPTESPDALAGLADSLSDCQTDEDCDGVYVSFNVGLTDAQRAALEAAVAARKTELSKPRTRREST